MKITAACLATFVALSSSSLTQVAAVGSETQERPFYENKNSIARRLGKKEKKKRPIHPKPICVAEGFALTGILEEEYTGPSFAFDSGTGQFITIPECEDELEDYVESGFDSEEEEDFTDCLSSNGVIIGPFWTNRDADASFAYTRHLEDGITPTLGHGVLSVATVSSNDASKVIIENSDPDLYGMDTSTLEYIEFDVLWLENTCKGTTGVPGTGSCLNEIVSHSKRRVLVLFQEIADAHTVLCYTFASLLTVPQHLLAHQFYSKYILWMSLGLCPWK